MGSALLGLEPELTPPIHQPSTEAALNAHMWMHGTHWKYTHVSEAHNMHIPHRGTDTHKYTYHTAVLSLQTPDMCTRHTKTDTCVHKPHSCALTTDTRRAHHTGTDTRVHMPHSHILTQTHHTEAQTHMCTHVAQLSSHQIPDIYVHHTERQTCVHIPHSCVLTTNTRHVCTSHRGTDTYVYTYHTAVLSPQTHAHTHISQRYRCTEAGTCEDL